MSLFVDTSVWSLALRRDAPSQVAEVYVLVRALEAGELVLTTGLVLQELLQGRRDHVDAAELRNKCRRGGVQIGTIDALLAQLCLRHDLTMLATDKDFRSMARHCPLKLWNL